MNATQLIEAHLEARGGIENILAIQSVIFEGTLTIGGNAIAMRVCRKRPNFLLVAFTPEAQTAREGWDGRAAWEYFPWRDAKPIYVSGVPEQALRRASDFDGPLVNWREKGHTLAYTGEDQFGQMPVHTVKVTLADGNEVLHDFDKATLLVARTRTRRGFHGSEPVKIVNILEDHQEVSGVYYAFRSTEIAGEDKPAEIMTWQTIEVNTPLDDSLFEKPKF